MVITKKSSPIYEELAAFTQTPDPSAFPAYWVMWWYVLRRAGTQTHSLMDKLKSICVLPAAAIPDVPQQLSPKGRSSTCLTSASTLRSLLFPQLFHGLTSRCFPLYPSVSTLFMATASSVFLLLPWYCMRWPVSVSKKRSDEFCWLHPRWVIPRRMVPRLVCKWLAIFESASSLL